MMKSKEKETMPLPMSKVEMTARGWETLDVLLITGDAYVDHPAFGAAVIGRVLEADGWRVGIIAQPDWTDPESLTVMGRPRLFVGITAGNLDSMLSHYTAARHKRKEDSYTPGGVVGKRPNLASMVYTQLAKKAFPGITTVIGGIEASLRRTAHYDYWQDKLRSSILADAKADLLIYGMGERAIREVAKRLENPLRPAAPPPKEGIQKNPLQGRGGAERSDGRGGSKRHSRHGAISGRQGDECLATTRFYRAGWKPASRIC